MIDYKKVFVDTAPSYILLKRMTIIRSIMKKLRDSSKMDMIMIKNLCHP